MFLSLLPVTMRKKQFFCKKKNENTYDQVEKVWWYESLLSLGEPQAVILGRGTSSGLGRTAQITNRCAKL